MPKVTINGEVFQFDGKYPLHLAIVLEEQIGMTFGKWEESLSLGSAKAVAGYIWLVLKTNDRDVSLADILSGKYELDTQDIDITDDGGAESPDPTLPAEDSPVSSATSGTSGSASSAKSSSTRRLRSTPSPSPSSTT